MDKNNKLGLKIVRTSQGYVEGLEVNGAQEWTKNIRDVREDLKHIENFQGDSTVLMMRCIDSGNLITIASLIDGRITDCISAWIYIPDNLIISGKKLVEIINITKNEILAVMQNDSLLKEIFSKEYESAPANRIYKKSNTDQYAYRYYGKGCNYELWELLDNIYQPYYQQYKSVFFIDKSSQLSCSVGDDLSNRQLYTSILANTPKVIDGFVPYVNGKIFDSPMYVSKGEVIEITWKKKDYEPIRTQTKANEGFMYMEPTVNQYRRLIPYEAIMVVDERRRSIQEYELSINHNKVNPGNAVPVSEAALNNVRIDVYADEYDPKGIMVDFVKSSRITVQLSKTSYEYKLAIPLENIDGYINLEPITTHKKLEKSPIKGYAPERRGFSRHEITYLKYAPYNKTFWIQAAIVLGIVLILGVALGAWGWNKLKTEKLINENSSLKYEMKQLKSKGGYNYSHQEDEEKTPKQEENVKDADEVLAYLDNNNVWNREKMEGFSQIKGLWDALNTHDFNNVLGFENVLKDSERFMKLVQAIKANKAKKFTTNYNTNQNDFDITIEKVKDQKGRIKNKGYIQALYDAGGSEGTSNNASTPGSKGNNSEQDNW